MIDETKHCFKCATTKSTTDFYKNAGMRDGLQTCCKACSKVAATNWQRNNRERYYKIIRDYKTSPKGKAATKLRAQAASKSEATIAARKVYYQKRKKRLALLPKES